MCSFFVASCRNSSWINNYKQKLGCFFPANGIDQVAKFHHSYAYLVEYIYIYIQKTVCWLQVVLPTTTPESVQQHLAFYGADVGGPGVAQHGLLDNPSLISMIFTANRSTFRAPASHVWLPEGTIDWKKRMIFDILWHFEYRRDFIVVEFLCFSPITWWFLDNLPCVLFRLCFHCDFTAKNEPVG